MRALDHRDGRKEIFPKAPDGANIIIPLLPGDDGLDEGDLAVVTPDQHTRAEAAGQRGGGCQGGELLRYPEYCLTRGSLGRGEVWHEGVTLT